MVLPPFSSPFVLQGTLQMHISDWRGGPPPQGGRTATAPSPWADLYLHVLPPCGGGYRWGAAAPFHPPSPPSPTRGKGLSTADGTGTARRRYHRINFVTDRLRSTLPHPGT